MFVPKLVTALKTYRDQFLGDLTAVVIVGVVALPLAIATRWRAEFRQAAACGRLSWTAIVDGLIISAPGGSRVQIGGPTGALVVMGLAKLGSAIKFIPRSVVTGFTSGIAVIIFSGEIKDFLGLSMGAVPSAFIAKWQAFGAHA